MLDNQHACEDTQQILSTFQLIVVKCPAGSSQPEIELWSEST